MRSFGRGIVRLYDDELLAQGRFSSAGGGGRDKERKEPERVKSQA